MDAKEFVKKFGWELVKRDIAALGGGFIKREDFIEHYGFDILNDLKTLVDAYGLVQSHGGLEKARSRAFLSMHISIQSLKDLNQAIQLVESVDENH